MKSKKIIGLSLASVMLLGLGLVGCDSQPTTQTSQQQSSGSNSDGKGTTSASGSSQDTGNSQGNQNSGQSNPSQGNSGSSQSGSSNQSGGSNSSTGGQSNTAPTTIADALQQVKTTLQTKVPLMLPITLPITQGKYLTATARSETWYYNAQFFEVNQPTLINSQAASTGRVIATIEGTEYSNSASSHDSIQGYEKINTPPQGLTVDLGHGIQAINQGATGHVYTEWNEGRWCIRLNSPSDPAYVSQQYKDRVQLAKDIVSYLDSHYLPAPQDIGVISIDNWNNSLGATIQWQYHEMTYQVTSKDPFVALQIAVAMAFQ